MQCLQGALCLKTDFYLCNIALLVDGIIDFINHSVSELT